MKVLVIDTGGTHVKILVSGEKIHREMSSGPTLTAKRMVSAVKKLAADWRYDVVSIGYPGLVVHGRLVLKPHNLGPGWVGFDFAAAFKVPCRVINDAAMQALGNYRGGKMLFLGLGTGLGSAMIVDGIVVPMELAHLPYKKGTYEEYVGIRGLKKHGKRRWQRHVADVVKLLNGALEPGDVVLGGGNVRRLKSLPPGCRAAVSGGAFVGGFRMWADMDTEESLEKVGLS
jgi:polyphosphate glucokinase